MTETDVAVPDKMVDISDLAIYAKRGCRHCFGRGYIGQNIKTHELVMCSCFDFTKEVVCGSTQE